MVLGVRNINSVDTTLSMDRSDIYLVFLFPFSRVESLSYPKELASGGSKNIYPRFELTSDFYKELLGNVQGTAGNSSR